MAVKIIWKQKHDMKTFILQHTNSVARSGQPAESKGDNLKWQSKLSGNKNTTWKHSFCNTLTVLQERGQPAESKGDNRFPVLGLIVSSVKTWGVLLYTRVFGTIALNRAKTTPLHGHHAKLQFAPYTKNQVTQGNLFTSDRQMYTGIVYPGIVLFTRKQHIIPNRGLVINHHHLNYNPVE